MAKFKVVVVSLGYASYATEREILNPIGAELVLAASDCLTEDAVVAAGCGADAILVREAPISARVIDALQPRLRAIVRYGVGVDNIDLAHARERRVYVANIPGYGTEEVSDHAAALLLACIRSLRTRDELLRVGRFETDIQGSIFRTTGKVLGLLGYGRIGRALHRKWQGFQPSRVLVYDPAVPAEQIRTAGAEPVDLDTLFAESDYLSLHAPLHAADASHRQRGLARPDEAERDHRQHRPRGADRRSRAGGRSQGRDHWGRRAGRVRARAAAGGPPAPVRPEYDSDGTRRVVLARRGEGAADARGTRGRAGAVRAGAGVLGESVVRLGLGQMLDTGCWILDKDESPAPSICDQVSSIECPESSIETLNPGPLDP